MDIDSIDITDSAFSLDVPITVPEIIDGTTDYTMFIYIGVAIILLIVGMFIYKIYKNKNVNEETIEDDCPGGFCTMNSESNRQI